jgi:hypothetical protein
MSLKSFTPLFGAPERDEGLELLGDGRLGATSAQPRPRKFQQRGIVDRLETRLPGIAKSEIDYDDEARVGERTRTAQADASIF